MFFISFISLRLYLFYFDHSFWSRNLIQSLYQVRFRIILTYRRMVCSSYLAKDTPIFHRGRYEEYFRPRSIKFPPSLLGGPTFLAKLQHRDPVRQGLLTLLFATFSSMFSLLAILAGIQCMLRLILIKKVGTRHNEVVCAHKCIARTGEQKKWFACR